MTTTGRSKNKMKPMRVYHTSPGCVRELRDDGSIYEHRISGWVRHAKLKAGRTPKDWINGYISRGWHKLDEDVPSIDDLEDMVHDSVVDAIDGCQVEPDGTCPHGAPSWLLVLGFI